MIKLPKNYFSNLTRAQYKEYLKLLPPIKNEKTQIYTMLAFTLIAMTFFGIFAINPTLTTIAELKRKFADLQFVNLKLITKNQSLALLQQKYQSMGDALPLVMDSLPREPEVALLTSQINGLLKNSNLVLKSYKTYGVEITPGKKPLPAKTFYFGFSLEAEGEYDDVINFTHRLTNINRLISLDTFGIVKDSKKDVLNLVLRGRQYFKP